MIKSILSPIDGSPDSFRAYSYSLILAAMFKARVEVLFVVDQRKTQMPFMYAGGAYDMTYERVYIPPDQELRKLYERLKTDLYEFAERCKQKCSEMNAGQDVEMNFSIKEGFPAGIIEEHAHAVDMVVVGQHGENEGLKQQTAGSTTEEIVRNSPRPVVVVPKQFQKPEKALFPYDGSRGSENTLQYYTSNLSEYIPNLIFLCAECTTEDKSVYDNEVNYLRQYKADVKVIQDEEPPIQAIDRVVEKEQPDLIMVGSHGRHKLVDYLLGSTTIHIIRKSTIPVLVIY